MKNFVLLMILFCTVHLYGQEVPLSQKCFPLNGTNPEDIISGQAADVYGEVHALTDRFGKVGKAVSFGKEGGYLSFPLTFTNTATAREITLTYWMYAGKDSIARAFQGEDREGCLLLGMEKKGERAVLNIYHKDDKQNMLPDQQWMWNNSNFSEGNGWYFIAIAYANDGTHFYMVTPKGNMTECYSAFTPDWELLSSICVGTKGDTPAAGMDDFKIYGTALSKEQVSVLYQSESQLGVGDETLINLATNEKLYSSTWYLHCVGLQETLRYVLQNRSNLSFLEADTGYALTMVLSVESDFQRWAFCPLKDTAKGKIFRIENAATGMNVAHTDKGVFQQVSDNTDSQKWCIGSFESNAPAINVVKKSKDVTPLREDIYYDKVEGVVRVRIVFPEAADAKVRILNSQGVLIRETSSDDIQSLEKDIHLQVNGIYLVTVESDNYRICRKVIVNK